MDSSNESSLEKAQKKLYSRNFQDIKQKPHPLSEKVYNTPSSWGENNNMPRPQIKEKRSFWYKFLIFSIIFFIFAVAISVFVIFKGGNIISSDNVEIVVNGPVSLGAGEEMSYQVSILNRNNVSLLGVDLSVEYPAGTVDAEDITKSLKRSTEEVGDIKSGDKTQKVMKAVLFGEENEKKNINVVVEYMVEGSNAIFVKEKSYEVIISSAPISILVSGEEEVSSGGNLELVITVASNSEKTISNAGVKVEYPFGFIFKESLPKASSGNNFWSLGNFAPKSQTRIVVKGNMEGQNEEERVFRVEAGIAKGDDIETLFTSFLHPIAIKKSALNLSAVIKGSADRVVSVYPGENIRVDLLWQNNLLNQISEVTASLKLETSGFLISGVSVPNGFFRQSDSTALWNKDNEKSLALLNPGEEGVLSMNIKIPDLNTLADPSGVFENPKIELSYNIKGTDLVSDSSSSSIENSDTRTIKISSPISFTHQVVKKSNNIYTIILTVKNPLNEVTGVKLNASLPSYMKWLGAYSPSEEIISYNSLGGGLYWNVGRLPAGVGYSNPSRIVSFDVEYDSGFDDLSSNPVFLRDVILSGEDKYTLKVVEYKISNINLSSK